MSKFNNMKWYLFEKTKLPSALYGYISNEEKINSQVDYESLNDGILIGSVEKDFSSSADFNPSIIVVDDFKSAETFSWLKTYAPISSPITQFARVVTKSDLNNFYRFNDYDYDFPVPKEAEKWASIVVGEILSQSESDVELKQTSASRAQACFSNAISRACIHYKSDLVFSVCIDRLEQFEANQRFVKRNILVSDLLPIWALVKVNIGDDNNPNEIANLVCDNAIDYARHTNKALSNEHGIFLTNFPELFEDSIENRVLAFNKLVDSLDSTSDKFPRAIPPNVLIAAAAFLVGRGTSHVFLLRKVAKRWHSVYLWFGLMAAFGGAKMWDAEWSKLAKITERNLKSKFDWIDSPSCDLCWPEYLWLSKTFSGIEVFNDLPKMVLKVLSIELLPGITCQFRLKQESKEFEINNDLLEREKNIYERESALLERERMILGYMDKVQDLTLQTRNALNVNSKSSAKLDQQSKFEFDQVKKTKSRRTKS